MKRDLISRIRKELQQNSDAKTKTSFQRFFKEEVKYHGVKSAVVVKIAKQYFQEIQNLNKQEIFVLCETLLKSGYCEEGWIAANWAYRIHQDFEPKDFKIFENWIDRYIDNWAECDTFCNHTLGAFIAQYPEYIDRLKRWTKSANRWLRRAAAVSLIIPAREGRYLTHIFEIADELLLDKDDMVQKGYGWMLKEASRKHQKEVFEYVIQNKKEMPRTALRYAIEKMPKDLKKLAMKK
jgi:3-methyladenine DNA glycosylase AlkD